MMTVTATRGDVLGQHGAAARPAVEIAHLRKTYRTLTAVDDISLAYAVVFGYLAERFFRWE
jgi:hypothetical protein